MKGRLWGVIVAWCVFSGSSLAMEAVPVSPSGEDRVAVIGEICPSFSWSHVEGATSYEVVVFEGEERLSLRREVLYGRCR